MSHRIKRPRVQARLPDGIDARVGDLVALPLYVERVELRPAQRGPRRTTIVRMEGLGHAGLGEDVTHDAADVDAFRELDVLPIVRSARSVVHLGQLLDEFPLLEAKTSFAVVRSYRRWALESAAIDLALRQAGTSLPHLLGMTPRVVKFVVSLRCDDATAVLDLVERYPQVRLKLDARPEWTDATVARLSTLPVDVLDLKGTNARSSVYAQPDDRWYARLGDAFPHALLEDPGLVVPAARRSWDEPMHSVSDLDRLPAAAAVNVKPSRIGSLSETVRLVQAAQDRGMIVYGGGHSELGPGRGQAQLLASMLYPSGPNDLAPHPLPSGDAAPLTGSLTPPTRVSGFRWE